jgi:hypothetical protein
MSQTCERLRKGAHERILAFPSNFEIITHHSESGGEIQSAAAFL